MGQIPNEEGRELNDDEKKPASVADLHKLMTAPTIKDVGGPAPQEPAMGKGLHFGGLTPVGRHWLRFRKRGVAWSAEITPAVGQAALWYQDVKKVAPVTGSAVAEQIARLCREDSEVTTSIRSLADAVGRTDKAGRKVAFTERGIEWLIANEWLLKRVTGKGQKVRTTYSLTVP